MPLSVDALYRDVLLASFFRLLTDLFASVALLSLAVVAGRRFSSFFFFVFGEGLRPLTDLN